MFVRNSKKDELIEVFESKLNFIKKNTTLPSSLIFKK